MADPLWIKLLKQGARLPILCTSRDHNHPAGCSNPGCWKHPPEEPEPSCPKCGSHRIEHHEIPSMAGYGVDWSESCKDCDWSESGHPDVI